MRHQKSLARISGALPQTKKNVLGMEIGMGFNETVSAERVHISFFGRRNVGKSSLVNAVTGQNLSVVSDIKGTTTDPVKKSMELLPIGPVVLIDTPGFDDEGELGSLRVQKTMEILAKTDVAVFVLDVTDSITAQEQEFLQQIKERNLPCIVVYNKADLPETLSNGKDKKEIQKGIETEITKESQKEVRKKSEKEVSSVPDCFPQISVSAEKNIHIQELKELLGTLAGKKETHKKLVADLLNPGDAVILVTPMDASAPKGRLILPQQQTIRELLDAGCMALICQPDGLPALLEKLKQPPKLVITDSQVFGRVAGMLPEHMPLTSFSILFARYKGELKEQVQAASVLSKLKEGDTILISEGCTHHRQCGDIGTVKLPAWIERFLGVRLNFVFTSGGDFPSDLSAYRLVIHCGGCMLNEAEMKHRLAQAKEAGVPMTNYGMVIAHINGILERSLEPFSLLKQ